MAIHNYVLSKYVSGTNRSDIELDINQLMDDGKYEIVNPKELIADYMFAALENFINPQYTCLLYTSPSPRDRTRSRMPSSA